MGDVLKYGLRLTVFCTGFRVWVFLKVAVSHPSRCARSRWGVLVSNKLAVMLAASGADRHSRVRAYSDLFAQSVSGLVHRRLSKAP